MNKKGFTIVEILIAFSVMTVGLLAVLALFTQNIQARSYIKNKLIASMLAQEGIELVRNIRDDNWHNTIKDWDIGSGLGMVDDIIQSGNNRSYTIDYDNGIDGSIDNLSNARLYINNDGFYDHTVSATSTEFFRLIKVIPIDMDFNSNFDNFQLKSIVRWSQNGRTHDYTITTMLSDWK